MLTPGLSKTGYKYALRPTPANHHILKTALPLGLRAGPPPKPIDHRPIMRPVRFQGQKGFCFAFATTRVKQANCAFWKMALGGPAEPLGGDLSPDYNGWKTQVAEGTFGQDQGGMLGDSFAEGAAWGFCPESFLPYDPNNKAHSGNAQCDVAAQPYRFGTPCTVAVDVGAITTVLSANHVIAFGMSVYPSFEDTGPDGIVKPVQPGEPLLGGHAMTWDAWELSPVTKTPYLIAENQWDTSWGDKGFCIVEASYLVNVWEGWTTT